MFSLAMEILFSEPSCREPESLVQISAGGNSWMPMEQYRFLRDAQVLDGLAGFNIGMVANWRSTLRDALVAAQLAVSVLLLAGGFLFVSNLIRASAFDAGFDTEHTIVASVWAVPELCTPNRFARLSDAGVERLRALAGVESVSLARAVPLDPFLEFTRDGGVIGADTSDRAVYTQFGRSYCGGRNNGYLMKPGSKYELSSAYLRAPGGGQTSGGLGVTSIGNAAGPSIEPIRASLR